MGDKVEMVEETEYDDVVQCDHSYDKRCHTTYVTNYESQQEEECEENFRKSCFIEHEQIAFNETVSVCREPLVKDCNVKGDEICRTEYESECWTKQEVHEVEDDVVECKTEVEEKCEDETSGYTTNTKCSKWPKEVCAVSKKPVKKYTPSLDVPRSLGSFAPLQDVGSNRELRNAMTKLSQWFRMLQRKNVTSSHRGPANMSPNLYPSLPLLRSVWMFLRRSAQGLGPTLGRLRSLWSRSGVIFLLKNLVLPKILKSSSLSMDDEMPNATL